MAALQATVGTGRPVNRRERPTAAARSATGTVPVAITTLAPPIAYKAR
jgi:hypothetical protein